uniref:Envelope glycoprotein E n=1 Tax=Human herpesvirus 2 TaxID=10310 RepID=A0A1U9ZJZ2_HHV2|nr:envelope glycoprotein E [Human alphaherpesvirus 2]
MARGAGLVFFVGVWVVSCLAAAPRTSWKRVTSGEDVVLLPAPAGPEERTRAHKLLWAAEPLDACGPLRPSWVALWPPRRVLETVVDAACMRAPEPLAIAYSPPFPAGDEGLYSELAWRDRVAVVNESLVIYGALETDSGLYTLSVVGLSDEARQVASVVLVVEPAPVPTPTPDDYDEEDDAGVSERTPVSVPPPTPPRRPPVAPPTHPRVIPEVSHVRGVTVHMETPEAILFAPGETFGTNVSIHAIAHDDGPYAMDVVWMRFDVPSSCAEMRIYEACLYHPQLPECLSPADAPCAVSSWAYRLAVRSYAGCSRTTPPPRCFAEARMEPVPGLAWLASTVNLEFQHASPQHAGLYLCVVYVDDHIHAWGHMTISTAAQYRNAVVEQHLPQRQPEPVEPTRPHVRAPHPAPSARGPLRLGAVLGAALLLAALGLSAWACMTCWRRRSWRAVKSRASATGPTYIRVADSELYADWSSDSEGERDGSLWQDPPERPDSPSTNGSGFEILSPTAPSVYPHSEGRKSRHPLTTFGSGSPGRRHSQASYSSVLW